MSHDASNAYQRQDYWFDLPPERIAQRPVPDRADARLLVAGKSGPLRHAWVRDLTEFLRPGDALALNQTKVMNARCYGLKDNGVRLELFLLDIQEGPARVPVLVRPAKRVKSGMAIRFPKAGVSATVIEKDEGGRAALAFPDQAALAAVIEADGDLPLPPYIKRESGPSAEDRERYQTVFARELGAVAAPTAGLHFTPELLDALAAKGVEIHYVTLHVGVGTFKPLTVDDIREHRMDPERYRIDPSTAQRLDAVRREGRRLIAVGTTVARCLESNWDGGFHAGAGEATAYIYPGYRFRAVDGMITNFHLPGSTLILLVAALMGRERILEIYREAIARDYRFYSYGDAMLLLP